MFILYEKGKYNEIFFDPVTSKFRHILAEPKIKLQHVINKINPQPTQPIQQKEQIIDATGLARAMHNGHTHVIDSTIYIVGSNSKRDWYG
ncbi:MAG: hypothetical protein ACKPKO_17850, partial [Candidatus Fonsibacter sp.]